MGKLLEFDFMDKDIICSKVVVDFEQQLVHCEDFTDVIYKRFFGLNEPNMDNFFYFLEDRCFDRNRPDVDAIMTSLGLPTNGYSPLAICKVTKGQTIDDNQWIRFKDDNIETYDDLINSFH
ncbi:MAG: hypothetical protein FWE25_10830 [Lachnospiraceae bacterium]|nr:hypothetical protein [Lachnospiraceae bacterium]